MLESKNGQKTFINELSMREVCTECVNRFRCIVKTKDLCMVNSRYGYVKDFYLALARYVKKNPKADIRAIPNVRACNIPGLRAWKAKTVTEQVGGNLILRSDGHVYVLEDDGSLTER